MKRNLKMKLGTILGLAMIASASGAIVSMNNMPAKAEGPAPELTFIAGNVVFDDAKIALKYAVDADNVDANAVKILLWNEVPETYEYGTQSVTLSYGGDSATINGEDYLAYSYEGLGAKQIADNIYACAYAEVDGVKYYSAPLKYSVLQYAYNKLGKAAATPSSDEDFKDLLNAMLDYGAAAQKYFKDENGNAYNGNRLANADFTYVKIANATLSDGFNDGLYLPGETLTITANEGYMFNVFSDTCFQDNGDGTVTLTVPDYNVIADNVFVDTPIEREEVMLTNTYVVEASSFAAGINYDAYLPTEITERVTAVKLGETEVNFTQDGNKIVVVSDATSLGAVGSQSSVALTIETATKIYSGMTVNVSTVAWGSSDVKAQVVAEVAGQKTSFADGKIILKVAPVAANKSLNWMNSGLAEYAAAMGFQTFGMQYYLSEACADGNGFTCDVGLNGWANAGAHVNNVQGAWTSVKRFYGTNSSAGDVNSYTIGDVNGLGLSYLALSNLNPGNYVQLRFGWAASVPTADAYIMIEFSKVPAVLAVSNERIVAAVHNEYQGMKTDLENGKVLLKISFSGAQTGLLFTTEFENYLKSLGAYTTFGMQYYIAGGADNAAFYVDCGTGAWTEVPNTTKNAWTQANYWNGSAAVPFELRDINTVDLGAAEGNKYTQIRMGWANNGTTPPTEVYLYITLK